MCKSVVKVTYSPHFQAKNCKKSSIASLQTSRLPHDVMILKTFKTHNVMNPPKQAALRATKMIQRRPEFAVRKEKKPLQPDCDASGPGRIQWALDTGTSTQ